MAVYIIGYAIPAKEEKVLLVAQLPEGVEGLVYRVIMEGLDGGAPERQGGAPIGELLPVEGVAS